MELSLTANSKNILRITNAHPCHRALWEIKGWLTHLRYTACSRFLFSLPYLPTQLWQQWFVSTWCPTAEEASWVSRTGKSVTSSYSPPLQSPHFNQIWGLRKSLEQHERGYLKGKWQKSLPHFLLRKAYSKSFPLTRWKFLYEESPRHLYSAPLNTVYCTAV